MNILTELLSLSFIDGIYFAQGSHFWPFSRNFFHSNSNSQYPQMWHLSPGLWGTIQTSTLTPSPPPPSPFLLFPYRKLYQTIDRPYCRRRIYTKKRRQRSLLLLGGQNCHQADWLNRTICTNTIRRIG